MEIEKDKQAWLELLKHEGTTSVAEEVRTAWTEALGRVDTASELAGFVVNELPGFYRAYGEECLNLIRQGLSPTVWEEAGLLLNPRTIPAKCANGISVVADGSVATEQWQQGVVTY